MGLRRNLRHAMLYINLNKAVKTQTRPNFRPLPSDFGLKVGILPILTVTRARNLLFRYFLIFVGPSIRLQQVSHRVRVQTPK